MKEKLKNLGKSTLIIFSFFFLYISLISLSFKYIANLSETALLYIDILFLSICSIYLIFIFNKDLRNSFKPFIKNFTKSLKKYIGIYLLTYILVIISNNLIIKFVSEMATNEAVNQNAVLTSPLTAIISTCILAPFYEEVLFRLNFKKIFKNKWKFILTTGIFFGSLHLLVAKTTLELLYIIPYSLLGIVLSYIYYDSNNIYNSIFFHALNNIIQVILILIGGTL
ncbi:MAG: CPBP family intramembrane metalloprotease [Bacilli bacterium]|nr:CPBP family intramembrane metalloprotease [Bacilli bacterium]